jgi:ATP-dependent DNA helicase RecG
LRRLLDHSKLLLPIVSLNLIVALVRAHQPVSREDIDKLLLDKLPEVLSQEQKLNRVHNLLRQLAETGRIQNVGGRRWPKWVPGPQ